MNANKRKLVEHLRLFALNPDYLIPITKDTIPKVAIGKIQRRQLKDRFEAGEFDSILH